MARLRVRIPIQEPRVAVKVSKSFRAKTRTTRRTVEAGHAFGIGIDDEKRYVVYRDLEIEVEPCDVVYITGDSGAGKSILLRELALQLSRRAEFGGVVMGDELSVAPGEIVVEGVGRDTSEAIGLLSMVGLSEAYIFLRRYRELSDGQKYRYRLAKAIASGKGTLILDEFCATLDRETARVVAYLTQKVCRKRGITLIAATTHRDLLEDLNPDLYIEKRLGADVRVEYREPEPRPCSLMREIRIEPGSWADYKALSQFHYRGGRPGGVRFIYRAVRGEELCGAILYVSSLSHPMLRGRNIAVPGLLELLRRGGMRSVLRALDRNFVRIARVVVYPKYRGIGLGARLVRETMPLRGHPYVEALAVMARYNPFFEHAGMTRIEYESSVEEKNRRLLERLSDELPDIDIGRIHSRRYLTRYVSRLRPSKLKRLRCILASAPRPPTRFSASRRGLSREGVVEALISIRSPPLYYIWRNPRLEPSIPSP